MRIETGRNHHQLRFERHRHGLQHTAVNLDALLVSDPRFQRDIDRIAQTRTAPDLADRAGSRISRVLMR